MKNSIFSLWKAGNVFGVHGIYFIDGQNKVLIKHSSTGINSGTCTALAEGP